MRKWKRPNYCLPFFPSHVNCFRLLNIFFLFLRIDLCEIDGLLLSCKVKVRSLELKDVPDACLWTPTIISKLQCSELALYLFEMHLTLMPTLKTVKTNAKWQKPVSPSIFSAQSFILIIKGTNWQQIKYDKRETFSPPFTSRAHTIELTVYGFTIILREKWWNPTEQKAINKFSCEKEKKLKKCVKATWRRRQQPA